MQVQVIVIVKKLNRECAGRDKDGKPDLVDATATAFTVITGARWEDLSPAMFTFLRDNTQERLMLISYDDNKCV